MIPTETIQFPAVPRCVEKAAMVSATPVRATLALLVTVTTSSVGWPTRTGDVPNVTFPCAALHDPATGRVAVYYGCADTVTGLAFGYIPEIIDFTKKNSIL